MHIIRQLPPPTRAPGAALLLLTLTCVIVPAACAAELIPWGGLVRPAHAVDGTVGATLATALTL